MEDKDGMDKSAICYIISCISLHYIKPKVSISICLRHIKLSFTGTGNEILDSIESFTRDIIFPSAQGMYNCDNCSIKKRPLFCSCR